MIGKADYSPVACWIWAPREIPDAWWMFRRRFILPADCRDGQLHITAAYHYLLYVNGTLVTRGPARSYDFCKAYDTIDVQAYLRTDTENVICILAPTHRTQDCRGVLAELTWRDSSGRCFSLATDRRWKCSRHAAFQAGTAGRPLCIELLLQWEEWFDARNEPVGWNQVDFDDGDWQDARELGSANMSPWSTLERSGISLLSDDPILPVSFAVVELAQLRPGYRVRLASPEEYLNASKLFLTEISCARSSSVQFLGSDEIYIDGKKIVSESDSRIAVLTEGTHLLCIHQAGYYKVEVELLLETEDEISFSGQRVMKQGDSTWAMLAFPAAQVNYPWHETVADVPIPSTLQRLLNISRAGDIPDDLRNEFVPVEAQAGSVAMDVITQRCYRVRGGVLNQAIENNQPRLAAPENITSPLSHSHHLLHAHPQAAEIRPTPGYDLHMILDFEREAVGYVEFTIDAPAGTIIDVQCFEMISPKGIFWMQHNGFRYVCREGVQSFTSYIRRGFRYASVTLRNFNQPIRFYSLQCRHTTYPVQKIGDFECSDWQLNHAYRMSVDTASVCMLDSYVDCPGHEQCFWAGDARVTALVNLMTFGAYELDQRSIRLIGQSLSSDWVRTYRPVDERYTSGRYVPVAAFPDYPEGGLPMWAFQWGLQCWGHWLHGANVEDLKENYAYLSRMLKHCRLLTNERNLFDMPGAWNLIDWAANDLSPYGEVTANNVLLVRCLRHAADMARTLGLDQEASQHAAEAEERYTAINRLCWDEQRKAYVDTVRDEWAYERYRELCERREWACLPWEKYRSCLRVSEQTNTLALLCGCVPSERLEAVKRIVQRAEAGRYVTSGPFGRSVGVPSEQEAPEGIVAIGSPFFLFFSLEALFQLNEGAAAMEIIRREWGKMAAMGLRTCAETFGIPRSVAHAWSAAPAVHLPEYVLGIHPLEPGYRTFSVTPCQNNLNWARGAVATPYGPISVHWRRNEKNEIVIDCTSPAECRRME